MTDSGTAPDSATAPDSGTPPRRTGQGRKPGDPDARRLLERIVRVDHAGEYGAVRIYQGQRAILGGGRHDALLRHMEDQEQEHLAYFSDQIHRRRGRPTALTPLWHVGAFALGAGTALLGEKAAMACTVAVEEVIDGHYAEQAEKLGADESELRETIDRFRREELEHRDIGYEHGAEQAPAYQLLSGAIRGLTKAAIKLSERV